jgi:dihydropteroate synthase
MKGDPRSMQKNPRYNNVVNEISKFLIDRAEVAKKHGIRDDRIIIDPGIGFGKRLEDNLDIIRNIENFKKSGYPVLIGPSRKSFISTILNIPVEERLSGTLAAITACVLNGADMIRVHDVKAAHHAIRMAEAFRGNR